MSSTPAQHVLVSISDHGLGHLAQTAPVVDALGHRFPQTRTTIRSGIDEHVLRRRIKTPFDYQPSEDDFGLVMLDPFRVDVHATSRRYAELHDKLDRTTERIAGEMLAGKVDLVLSNVGYLPLAAAARAGIRNIAFSSINWRDVVDHYCDGLPDISSITAQIEAIYLASDMFLRLVPGLDMPGLSTIPIDKMIATKGRNRRPEIDQKLDIHPHTKLVVFSFSESDGSSPPALSGAAPEQMIAVGPSHWRVGPVWRAFAEIDMPFVDLAASSDAVVAKPGYGIMSETALNGKPTLLVPRDDWPESKANLLWQDVMGVFREAHKPLEAITAEDIFGVISEVHSSTAIRIPDIGGEQLLLDLVFDTQS